MIGWLHRRREPLWQRLLLAPLTPLAWLHRLVVALRLLLYRVGWLASERVDLPVVSVGNLAVGGAGKTPIVMYLAQLLQRRGVRVAVLSQGYGGTGQGHRVVSLGGPAPLETAETAGDEPILIAKRCPGVQVLVGPSRAKLARMAKERLGAGVAILDDGFQHLSLRRDLDLVVLDGASPFGNGRLLPRGPLREPPTALSRADLCWISKADEGGAAELEAAAEASLFRVGLPPVRSRYRVAGIVRSDLRTVVPEAEWRGAKVFLLAGLARPGSFRKTVRELGLAIVGEGLFRDHHFFTLAELDALFERAEAAGAERIVCTEKDAVRLPASFAADPRILVVRIEVELLSGEELLEAALARLLGEEIEAVA